MAASRHASPPRRWSPPACAWAAARSAARCSRPPTNPASRRRGRRRWPRPSPGHRLPPRAAPRRHLLGGLRDAHRRRRAHHLEPRRRPGMLAAEFVNNGRGLFGRGFRTSGRGKGVLRAGRQEQAARLPGQPDGVLARDLGASRCACIRSSTSGAHNGRGLRRAQRHAGARGGDGVVKFAGPAERLRQRRRGPNTATASRRCTPT